MIFLSAGGIAKSRIVKGQRGMYFSMDNMGDENLTKLVSISEEAEKWSHIAQFAKQYGFTGIQVNPMYQKTLGLKLIRIPEVIRREFRLTYHLGGLYPLSTKDDEHKLQADISNSLLIASSIGAEDVSLHPPYLSDDSPNQRKHSRERFQNLLEAWVQRFTAHGITLSLETHVTSSVFIFNGIQDFRDFVLSLPGLSVLVDVSHNYYDGYEMTELISYLRPLSITGLHLSDAIRGEELGRGTHLPIGQGHIDFKKLFACFNVDDIVYAALEVRGSSSVIADSLTHLRTLL